MMCFLISTAAMDQWRADAEARKASKEAEHERRRVEEWMERDAVRVQQQVDDRIAAAIAEAIRTEHELMIQTLALLTRDLLDKIDDVARELRAEGSGRGADKGACILDLPNPLVRRAS
jgi:hypothetical protein